MDMEKDNGDCKGEMYIEGNWEELSVHRIINWGDRWGWGHHGAHEVCKNTINRITIASFAAGIAG